MPQNKQKSNTGNTYDTGKNRKKPLVIVTAVLAFGLLLGGCSLGNEIQDWKAGDSSAPENSSSVLQSGQIILDRPLVISGSETPVTNMNEDMPMMTVSLYFANANGTKLIEEKRVIPKEEGVARATIGELIMGPDTEALLPTLPAGTVLQDINIKDGICIVDFNSNFQNGIATVEEENLCIYSLVNTLTQFDSVNEVKILVNGRHVEKFKGAVDVSANISRNTGMIE